MGGFLGLKAQSDHRFASENLSAYLDGQLTVHEKERVEHHLAACADCRQELSTLRKTVALLHQASMKPVPRSFTLPLSVQAEQAHHRRWNMTYAFMRGATVAVSLLLVLLISGDVLLRQGIAGVPGLASPRASSVMATAPAEAEQEQAPQMAAPAAEGTGPAAAEPQVQALQAPAVAEDQSAEGSVAMGGGAAPAAEPTEGQAEASIAAVSPTEAPQTGAESQLKSAPMARSMSKTPANEATPEENLAASAPEAAGSPEATGSPEGAPALLQAPQPQPTPEALAQSDVAASPVAEGDQGGVQSEGYAGEEPTSPKVAAVPEESVVAESVPAQSAPERGAEAPATAYNLSPLWSLWQVVRTGAFVLAGLLLVLIGGLIWSGYKRRV